MLLWYLGKWYLGVKCCYGVWVLNVATMLGVPVLSRSCSSGLSEEEADSLPFSEMVLKFAGKVSELEECESR